MTTNAILTRLSFLLKNSVLRQTKLTSDTVSLVSIQFDSVENDYYFFTLKKQAEKIALVDILGTPTSTANQATSHFMGQRCE